jgi:hypothetical protein
MPTKTSGESVIRDRIDRFAINHIGSVGRDDHSDTAFLTELRQYGFKFCRVVKRSFDRLNRERRGSGSERIEIVSSMGRGLRIKQETDARHLRGYSAHQFKPFAA